METLRLRLEGLRKAKNTTIIKREREKPLTPLSPKLGQRCEWSSNSCTSSGVSVVQSLTHVIRCECGPVTYSCPRVCVWSSNSQSSYISFVLLALSVKLIHHRTFISIQLHPHQVHHHYHKMLQLKDYKRELQSLKVHCHPEMKDFGKNFV